MAKHGPKAYFDSLGGAFAGLLLGFLPAVGIGLVVAFVGDWPFFTALLWTVGLIEVLVGVISYFVSLNEAPPLTGGYPPGYLPNVHAMGTQEYYLNEIMNQQAAENERKRRQD